MIEMTAVCTATEEVLSEEDSARANVYSLLATLLSTPPTSELLEYLAQLEKTVETEPGMPQAWSALGVAARTTDPKSITHEHHDLFIGIGRGELVPHGSWYITGFLNEQPLAQLRDDLTALGFARRDDVHEPEDHATALCETLAIMISNPEKYGFETQQKFFTDHIEPWMVRFFSDLCRAKNAHFYRAVGELGERFVKIETAYFSMTV